jgi:hypothetical protein
MGIPHPVATLRGAVVTERGIYTWRGFPLQAADHATAAIPREETG